jgi:3-deoxy-D-manno-octulosonate 8-phosphate phosphatase (KDO 8-P phosphatase)
MNNADAQLATCYGPVSQAFLDRAAKIRLLILDVDGVLSDGLIYMGNHGEELKAFNVRDGYGIRCALTSGIEVAIITGRKAKLVEDRCQTLGITHLYQGSRISCWRSAILLTNWACGRMKSPTSATI